MGITVLTGAGSVLDVGGYSTNDITEKVIFKKQYGENFAKHIYDELNKYYAREPIHPNEIANFEDIFNALEQLASLSEFESYMPKQHKHPLGAFLPPRIIDQQIKKHNLINQAQVDLIRCVGELVYDYETRFDSNDKHRWFTNFWNEISRISNSTLCTLNYDGLLEKSIGNALHPHFKMHPPFQKCTPLINSLDKTLNCINY